MNIYNGFDLIVAVVFSMVLQLGGIGPKSQDLFISFRLGELESLPDFHLIDLQEKIEIYMLNNETVQANNLTGK